MRCKPPVVFMPVVPVPRPQAQAISFGGVQRGNPSFFVRCFVLPSPPSPSCARRRKQFPSETFRGKTLPFFVRRFVLPSPPSPSRARRRKRFPSEAFKGGTLPFSSAASFSRLPVPVPRPQAQMVSFGGGSKGEPFLFLKEGFPLCVSLVKYSSCGFREPFRRWPWSPARNDRTAW